jgi:hypothetical protein
MMPYVNIFMLPERTRKRPRIDEDRRKYLHKTLGTMVPSEVAKTSQVYKLQHDPSAAIQKGITADPTTNLNVSLKLGSSRFCFAPGRVRLGLRLLPASFLFDVWMVCSDATPSITESRHLLWFNTSSGSLDFQSLQACFSALRIA